MPRLIASLAAILCTLMILLGLFADFRIDVSRRRQIVASAEIWKIVTALEEYKFDKGQYPTAREGLDALVTGAYIERDVLSDPWHRPFEYRVGASRPEILSFGADGKPGGDFFNTDISSRKLWAQSPQSHREIRTELTIMAIWLAAWIGLGICIYSLLSSSRQRR